MYFVKIDRSSIKKNPNYPVKYSYVPTTKRNPITINVTRPSLYDLSQDYIEVVTLSYDPYIYKYEPLKVTCKYCGSTFDHTKLLNYLDAHCEICYEHVCPNCGYSECVDIEYESVYKVIRESKGGCG